MKKKANSVSEHCWDVREVEAYFTFFLFFCLRGFLLRQQILDLLQPMIGRAKSPKKLLHLALWYLVLKMAETHIHKIQH